MKFLHHKEAHPDEVSIISTGVTINGDLITPGSIRIDGTINGNVNAGGNITIGVTGKIQGDMTGFNIAIGGNVTGRVQAQGKITLEEKSTLIGNLQAKVLAIETGAFFRGNSEMEKPEPIQEEQ